MKLYKIWIHLYWASLQYPINWVTANIEFQMCMFCNEFEKMIISYKYVGFNVFSLQDFLPFFFGHYKLLWGAVSLYKVKYSLKF
jgi:hypothetical protein